MAQWTTAPWKLTETFFLAKLAVLYAFSKMGKSFPSSKYGSACLAPQLGVVKPILLILNILASMTSKFSRNIFSVILSLEQTEIGHIHGLVCRQEQI